MVAWRLKRPGGFRAGLTVADFIKEAHLVVDLAGVHGTEALIGVEEVGNVVS